MPGRAGTDEKENTIQLPLTYDEYEIVGAALRNGRDQARRLAKRGGDVPSPTVEDVFNIIDDQWGEADHPDDSIELTRPQLETLAWALKRVSDLPGDIGPLRKKVQSLLGGKEQAPEPEQTPQEIEQDRWRKALRDPVDVPPHDADDAVDPRFNLDFRNEVFKRLMEKKTMKITKSKLKQLILEELEEMATSGAGAGGKTRAPELAALVGKNFGAPPEAVDPAAAEQQPLTLASLGDILKGLAVDQPEGSDIGDFVKAFLAKLGGG
jgi:hypothetical protein